MTAPWQAGHTYVPESVVVPGSSASRGQPVIENPDFATGDLSGWTPDDASVWSVEAAHAYSGSNSVRFQAAGATLHSLTSTSPIHVSPGDQVHAGVRFQPIHEHDSRNWGKIGLEWRDKNGNLLDPGYSGGEGYGAPSQQGGYYMLLTVDARAPADAATAHIVLNAASDRDDVASYSNFDAVTASVNAQLPPTGLVYKAVQSDPGKSGSNEPAWPQQAGQTVQDNQVTWEAIVATGVTWIASPLCESGGTEPDWPAAENATVRDGTINWTATTPQVKGAPASKIVTVAANKVFVGDKDVVRFCATNDATDWTSENDAGYLPTGLQAIGETICTSLSIYRANLVAWTTSSMQVWQVDPDPTRMALVDAVEGVGSSYIRADAGVMNDLYFTSRLGVRSVGITATTGTMGAYDVGSAVDELVREALAAGIQPIGMFYANASQFWLFCGAEAFVFSLSKLSKVYAWSRYTFPWPVTDACPLDGKLYVRAGDDVYVLDETVFADDVADAADPPTITPTRYPVTVQWPWLNMSSPGTEKMMIGVDAVVRHASGTTYVSVGYDENDENAFSQPVGIAGDTRPGEIVPIPVAAPSFAPKLTFDGGSRWELSAVTLYYNGMRVTA